MNSGATTERLDLHALKQQISAYLGKEHPKYWELLKNFFKAKLSKLELDFYAIELFGENLHLHNNLILGILKNSYHPARPAPSTSSGRRSGSKAKASHASSSGSAGAVGASVLPLKPSAQGATVAAVASVLPLTAVASSSSITVTSTASSPVDSTPVYYIQSQETNVSDSGVRSYVASPFFPAASSVAPYTHTHSHQHSHSHPHSVPHAHAHSLSNQHPHSHSHSLAHPHSHQHSLVHPHSHSHSLSHPHSHSHSHPHQSPSKPTSVSGSQPYFSQASNAVASTSSPSFNPSDPSTPVVASNSIGGVNLINFGSRTETSQPSKKTKKASRAQEQKAPPPIQPAFISTVKPTPLAVRRARFIRSRLLLKYMFSHSIDMNQPESTPTPPVQSKSKKSVKKTKDTLANPQATSSQASGSSFNQLPPPGAQNNPASLAQSSPAPGSQSLGQITASEGSQAKKMKLEVSTKPTDLSTILSPSAVAAMMRSSIIEPDGRKLFELPDLQSLKTRMQCLVTEAGMSGSVSEEASQLMYRALENHMKDILHRCISASKTFSKKEDTDTSSTALVALCQESPNAMDVPSYPLNSPGPITLSNLASPRQQGSMSRYGPPLHQAVQPASQNYSPRQTITSRDLFAVATMSPHILGEDLLVNQERLAILR